MNKHRDARRANKHRPAITRVTGESMTARPRAPGARGAEGGSAYFFTHPLATTIFSISGFAANDSGRNLKCVM